MMRLSWLALLALGLGVLQAQPVVTVAPTDETMPAGVTIVSPSDAAFEPLIGSVLHSQVSFFRPILPYSIIVRNQTPEPIRAVVILVAVVNADGRIANTQQRFDVQFPLTSGNFPAVPSGGAAFFAADRRYSDIAARMHGDRLPRYFNAPAPDEIATYDSARSITFTLGSVLFADGRLAGADTDHRFEDYTSQLAAEASMGKAVLAYQGDSLDDLKRFLATVSGSGDRWPKRLAREYSAILDREGADSLFNLVKRSLPPDNLSVHR
ncbi:MAG: hypothetical protein WBE37_30360 [Bryobacteraceae bacterium]